MTRTLPLFVFITACLPDFPKRDFTEDPTHDGDSDGVTELDGDCDDAEPLAYPGAEEVCDGIDNDCDGDADEDDALDAVIWYSDGDRDGFGTDAFTVKACAAPSEAYADNDDDCNDSVAEINPDASETCAPFDENCDGVINEGEGDTGAGSTLDTDTWYKDTDLDGYGRDDETIESCDRPEGYVLDGGDCDDGNPDISPRETEHCDGIDNDCDTLTDDEDPGMVGEGTWYVDTDGDGFGNPMSDTLQQCAQPDGHVLNATDCDDTDTTVFPFAVEVCNTVDDDCDGVVDDGVTTVYFADTDADGFGDMATAIDACAAPEGHVSDWTDCDDDAAESFPGAPEQCDEADNDCDGITDEDAADAPTWYRDRDDDGYGDPESPLDLCSRPEGYTDPDVATDCDDTKGNVYPGATETCFTTYDDDCDGSFNDQDATGCSAYFVDGDDDGYGDPSTERCQCTASESHPSTDGTDCNDATEFARPGLLEACADEIDNDCDGLVNEEDATGCDFYHQDVDGDTYGVTDESKCLCEPYGHYSADLIGDCDDGLPAVHPDATEVCFDGIDNDCDGRTDDSTAYDATEWYVDLDSDGYGTTATTVMACEVIDGYVDNTTDCDDSRINVNPGATETCGTPYDDDCDADDNDEGATGCSTFYSDKDGDTFGDPEDSSCVCDPTAAHFILNDADCDDDSSSVNPVADELCATEFDDDCNGRVNEDDAEDCTKYYRDNDGDDYGTADFICACGPRDAYFATAIGDCDDDDPTKSPGLGNCGVLGYEDRDDVVAIVEHPLEILDRNFDYNGDGKTDLLVGMGSFFGGFDNSGAAAVFFGPLSGVIDSVLDADVILAPAETYSTYYGAIGLAADFDGDGQVEILVGPGGTHGERETGTGWIFGGGLLGFNDHTAALESVDVWKGTHIETLPGFGEGGEDGIQRAAWAPHSFWKFRSSLQQIQPSYSSSTNLLSYPHLALSISDLRESKAIEEGVYTSYIGQPSELCFVGDDPVLVGLNGGRLSGSGFVPYDTELVIAHHDDELGWSGALTIQTNTGAMSGLDPYGPAVTGGASGFGRCVGDIDNDGWEDIAIGLPEFFTHVPGIDPITGLPLHEPIIGRGIVTIASGVEVQSYLSPEMWDVGISGDTFNSIVIKGSEAYIHLGQYFSDPIDFDGDGYDDLFLSVSHGGWGFDPAGGVERTVVFFGPIEPGEYTEAEADGSLNWGDYLYSAGDTNGDGYDDLWVGPRLLLGGPR